MPGRIALIQRGTCFLGVKVLNAQAAGASGVILFNEGNPGRTGLLIGSLFDAAGNPFIPTIPVAFTTFAVGQNLYNQYQSAVQLSTPLPTMNLSIEAVIDPNRTDWNVIADSKGGRSWSSLPIRSKLPPSIVPSVVVRADVATSTC